MLALRLPLTATLRLSPSGVRKCQDCPAKKLESDTKRAEIKQLIASLAANNPQIEANIFNAVKNVDTAKLLGWRDANGKHNFLDQFD